MIEQLLLLLLVRLVMMVMMMMMIIIMSVFLECLSIRNMLNCAEKVQIQKYKTHVYKAPQTACVQTIMLKHPDKQ